MGDFHQCPIISYLEMSILENIFGGSVDNDVNKHYRINIMVIGLHPAWNRTLNMSGFLTD